MSHKSNRPGVLFYFDILPALEQLPYEAVGKLILSAFHYAKDGNEPKFDDVSLSFAWAFIKPLIDKDGQTYDIKARRGQWLSYCKQCKRDGNEPLDFDTWCIRTDNDTLRTDNVSKPTTTTTTSTSTSTSTTTSTTSNRAAKPPTPIPDTNFGSDLQDAFERWLTYKKERREGYKETGLKALITQITNQAAIYGEHALVEIIELSMASGWKGIIFDKLKNVAKKGEHGKASDTAGDSEEDNEYNGYKLHTIRL